MRAPKDGNVGKGEREKDGELESGFQNNGESHHDPGADPKGPSTDPAGEEK